MTSPRIFVTPRSLTRGGHPALTKLESAGFELVMANAGVLPAPDELLAKLPGCVGYLAGVEPVSANVLRVAADAGLRVISRNGSGVSNLDVDLCAELGIDVLRVRDGNTRSVAELAFGFMISLARGIPASDQNLKRQNWERIRGSELAGKTLGVIGYGNIGKLVAKMAVAWEMRVVAHDVVESDDGVEFFSLDELVTISDFISLHCPPPGDGKPLFDEELIAKIKSGTFLINTARTELVDVLALLNALDLGSVAGYATDVLDGEPPSNWSLAKHERVIATPHIGAFTEESVDRCAHLAVDQMIKRLSEVFRN